MDIGSITGHIDVAQVVLYLFWIFFFGLIFYLRREDRREGYPLENDVTGEVETLGPIFMPEPKTFALADGSTVTVPDYKRETRPLNAEPIAPHPGAPLEPTGNALLAGVGPGSWAERQDKPDVGTDGEPVIRPLRVASDFIVADGEPDPRGMDVIGADGEIAGTVSDVWVDRAESIIRYLEVSVGDRTVMLPWNFADVTGGAVDVTAIMSGQFADVPGIANPDQITLLEEEKVMAYFGAGTLYAHWRRAEPLV